MDDVVEPSRFSRSCPPTRSFAETRIVVYGPFDYRSVCATAATPFLWCLGRPKLIWPTSLIKQDHSDKWLGVVVHELAHLKRRDHWVAWLELIAACLWWWNPLFWYVRRRLLETAESACDSWVVSSLPKKERRAYPHTRAASGEADLSVKGRQPQSESRLRLHRRSVLRQTFSQSHRTTALHGSAWRRIRPSRLRDNAPGRLSGRERSW